MLSGQMIVCVLLALLSSLAFAVATVAQQRAAAQSSDEVARSRKFLGELLRSPLWWAGTAGNGGGYLLQALALGFGPLVVVAPILVTSLLFALPLGARLVNRRLTASAWRWGLVLVISLSAFLALGRPDEGASYASAAGWLFVAAIGLPIVVACVVLAHARTGAARACLLAIADGVLAGVNALLTKSVVATVHEGLFPLLTTGETYGLLVVGLLGIYLQQLAFQSGDLQNSLPIIAVLEPTIAAALGLSLLHEQLQTSGARLGMLAVVIVAMALATIGLARSQGRAVEGT